MLEVTDDVEFLQFWGAFRFAKPSTKLLEWESYMNERIHCIFRAVVDRPMSLNNLMWPIHLDRKNIANTSLILISAKEEQFNSSIIPEFSTTYLLVDVLLFDAGNLLFQTDGATPAAARLELKKVCERILYATSATSLPRPPPESSVLQEDA